MNAFRHLLRAAGSHPPIGTWLMSASALVAEAVGHAGFDWGVIDMEHAPLDLMGVVHMLQAVGNTRMVPAVRVPSNDAVTIKRVLDAGATTVMVPMVQDAGEAAHAVAAMRYPPEGVRGVAAITRASKFGTTANYAKIATDEIGVILQLESPRALAALERIAAVPGVDALFIGPSDLAGNMGLPGQSTHASVMDAMAKAVQRCKSIGMPVGTLGAGGDVVAQYRAMGFDFVAVGTDLGLLMRGASQALQSLHAQQAHSHVHSLTAGTTTEAGR